MTSSHILTTTSLALLAAFSAIACGGSEVEPADQSQRAGLTQGAEPQPAADAVKPGAPRDHHRRPRGERGFGPRSPEKLLERFDANKDGALQAAELPERMQERIADIDKSGDGVVSKDELSAHFEAKKAEHAKRFAERAKERFEKRDGILTSGQADGNTIAVPDHLEPADRFAYLSE